jgi:hypothetical protein
LNKIASRYESYKFLKLIFRFVTERPTTESGYLALVIDYNPSDAAPSSKSVAFQYEGTAKCAPWENVAHVSTAKNLSKRRTYLNRFGVLTGAELDLSDTGNLFVCAGGNVGSGYNLGELWCDYEVCFDTPQLDPKSDSVDSALAQSTGTSETDVFPFGDDVTLNFNGAIPFLSYTKANGFLFNRDYRGLVAYNFTGTGITSAKANGSTAVISNESFSTNGTKITGQMVVTATVGQTLDFEVFPLNVATVTSGDFRIGRYDSI